MLYNLEFFLWDGVLDINQGNKKNTGSVRNVASQKNAENFIDGPSSDRKN